MTTSSPPALFTGEVHMECQLSAAAPDEARAALLELQEAFIDAVRRGMFSPGALLKVTECGASDEDSSFSAVFSVSDLPAGAFRVLLGMLCYFDEVIAPLESRTVWSGDRSNDLLARYANADWPPGPGAPGFQVAIVPPGRAAPPLLVRFALGTRPTEEDREELLAAFSTWDALVCGGYPSPVDAPGDSGVGGPESRFTSPSVLQHTLDAWRADSACFNPLLNLAHAWRGSHPVVSVEVQ